VRTPIALYLLALVVRLALIALFPDPAYVDSAYYVDAARRLAGGDGLTVDFVWVFAEVGGRIPDDPTLPIPAFAHWMPLASLVQVPFILALGPTPLASALPFALAGSLAAPLAWAIGRDAGARDSVAIGAGILLAVPALSVVFMPQPDNFSLYQPLVAGSLWMAARGLRGDGRAFAIGGLLAGLATLSRNDGVLVAAVLAVAFTVDRWRAWRSDGTRAAAIPAVAAAASAGLFLLCVAPWYVRQIATFGQLSPSTASGRVLFIRSIDEWNSITSPASLDWLLSWGAGPLLASRLLGIVAASVIAAVLLFAVVLIPFLVVGAWRRRRDPSFGPYLAYAVVLLLFSGVVSAVHVPGGTFIHSAVALAPHGYLLALEGVAVLATWLVMRRARGAIGVDSAVRLYVGGIVVLVVVLGVAYVPGVHAGWNAHRDRFVAIGEALRTAGADPADRVMSIDASGTRYWTGQPGVVLVNDPLETIGAVATAYDIRWLVVDRADGVPAVGPALVDDARPAWIGPAAWRDEDKLALFPVCTRPADERCMTGSAQ
jgi:hypothetical protein